jgi:hypothetical protein
LTTHVLLQVVTCSISTMKVVRHKHVNQEEKTKR